MKIAVTYDNGRVFQHFGHTENFKFYTIEDNKITATAVLSSNGSGHGALAAYLQLHGAQALICGGIGQGALNALSAAGIRVYAGVNGSTDAAVEALLNGTLAYSTTANCSHHDGAHECGEHGCH